MYCEEWTYLTFGMTADRIAAAASRSFGSLAAGVPPGIDERAEEDLFGGIEQADAARCQRCHHVRVQQERPAVGGRVGQQLPDLVDVEADAGSGRHVRHPVGVAGIVAGQGRHDCRVQPVMARQLRAVELAVEARLHMVGENRAWPTETPRRSRTGRPAAWPRPPRCCHTRRRRRECPSPW